MAYTTPIHIVMYSMTSGVSVGSSSSGAVRWRSEGDDDHHGAGGQHREGENKPFRQEIASRVSQRGRSAATATIAGTVMSRTKVSGDVGVVRRPPVLGGAIGAGSAPGVADGRGVGVADGLGAGAGVGPGGGGGRGRGRRGPGSRRAPERAAVAAGEAAARASAVGVGFGGGGVGVRRRCRSRRRLRRGVVSAWAWASAWGSVWVSGRAGWSARSLLPATATALVPSGPVDGVRAGGGHRHCRPVRRRAPRSAPPPPTPVRRRAGWVGSGPCTTKIMSLVSRRDVPERQRARIAPKGGIHADA